jgi:hypothetical protein
MKSWAIEGWRRVRDSGRTIEQRLYEPRPISRAERVASIAILAGLVVLSQWCGK